MGCFQSSETVPGVTNEPSQLDISKRWRVKMTTAECKLAFELDGTLPKGVDDEMVALRVYLEDPVSLSELAKFAQARGQLDMLLCWIEVLQYKMINQDGYGYQRSGAMNIYHKYFCSDAVVPLPSVQVLIPEVERTAVQSLLKTTESKKVDFPLPNDLFDKFGQRCLTVILNELFLPFKSTPEYAKAIASHREKFNKMELKHFVFIEVLGEGAFGMVVRCKKKTTGKHYAMKIQCKRRLLSQYPQNPERVSFEKEAVSKCHHPFIVSMDYAFQTKRLAIMVTGLGSATNLSVLGTISEERALFYGAEIALGLDHIHKMGMIYRDLKPANVLLNEDGHIQLVDLGCVVDVEGNTLGTLGYYDDPNDERAAFFSDAPVPPKTPSSLVDTDESDNKLGLMKRMRSVISSKILVTEDDEEAELKAMIAKDMLEAASKPTKTKSGNSVSNSNNTSTARKKHSYSMAEPPTIKTLRRANSVMGTGGYMAPEMVAQLMCTEDQRTGYTKTVDYWSLGVTLFSLLTGFLPFKHYQVASFSEHLRADCTSLPPEYTRGLSRLLDLEAQHKISKDCSSFVQALLLIDGEKRLGGGRGGILDFQTHHAVAHFQWAKLEQKLVSPPATDGLNALNSHEDYSGEYGSGSVKTGYSSFNQLMRAEGREFMSAVYACEELKPEEQKYYSTWDLVTPIALMAEVGAQWEEDKRRRGLNEPSFSLTLSSPSKLIPRIFGSGSGDDGGSAGAPDSHSWSDMRRFSPHSPTGNSSRLESSTDSSKVSLAAFGTTKNIESLAMVSNTLRQLGLDADSDNGRGSNSFSPNSRHKVFVTSKPC